MPTIPSDSNIADKSPGSSEGTVFIQPRGFVNFLVHPAESSFLLGKTHWYCHKELLVVQAPE